MAPSSFDITAGRALGLNDDGVAFFDTAAHPVQFYPLADKISISGQTISFPDFHHANAYAFAAGASGGSILQSCQSFVTIPYQEWGPSDQPGMTDDLADTVIGVAPAGTDILMARVKLSRTNAPDQVNGNNVPVAFQESEWVMCDGGTLLVEWLPPIVRMLWIRLADTPNVDGTTNILLTRKQSVSKRAYSYWRAGNSPTSSGWTYGGTNGRYGHIVKSIESKGPATAIGGVLTFRRGDGSQCSLTDASDYASTYQGDIEIIPGKADIDIDDIGGGTGLNFFLTDVDFIDESNDTHTSIDRYFGPAPVSGQTRHVIVAFNSYEGLGTSADHVLSVTIGGVLATQVVEQERYVNATGANDHNYISGIYIAEVPTGDVGDIEIDYSDFFWAAQIDVYAAYDLTSATPDDTQKTDTPGTLNLANLADGVAVTTYLNNSASGSTSVTGIDNVAVETFLSESVASRQFRRFRAFQRTTGSTLAIAVTDSAGVGCHVAASFH